MEELKKDVESAKILGTHHHHHHHHHKAFIGAMDLNLLQKKADEYNQAMAAASDWLPLRPTTIASFSLDKKQKTRRKAKIQ